MADISDKFRGGKSPAINMNVPTPTPREPSSFRQRELEFKERKLDVKIAGEPAARAHELSLAKEKRAKTAAMISARTGRAAFIYSTRQSWINLIKVVAIIMAILFLVIGPAFGTIFQLTTFLTPQIILGLFFILGIWIYIRRR